MIKLDVDIQRGGLKLDEQFLVDFGADKDDILLAHEMRYIRKYGNALIGYSYIVPF